MNTWAKIPAPGEFEEYIYVAKDRKSAVKIWRDDKKTWWSCVVWFDGVRYRISNIDSKYTAEEAKQIALKKYERHIEGLKDAG